MNSPLDAYRMDKKAFTVATLGDEADDRTYWHQRTPDERLEALELLRQMYYGYNPLTDRLQRVLTVTQLRSDAVTTILLSIPTDPSTAEAFASKSPEEHRKIEVLLSLRLHELVEKPRKSLQDLMDELSEKAEARGLTPEILDSILHHE